MRKQGKQSSKAARQPCSKAARQEDSPRNQAAEQGRKAATQQCASKLSQDELAPPPPMQSATPPGVAPVTMADRLEKLEQELQRMNERQVAAATLPPPAHSPPASPTPPGLFTQKHSTSSASDADWIRPQSEHKDLLERVSEMEVKIEALDQALVRTQGLASRAAEMEVKPEALELKILQLENDPSATEEANVVLVEKPGHDFHQGLVPAEPCFAFR